MKAVLCAAATVVSMIGSAACAQLTGIYVERRVGGVWQAVPGFPNAYASPPQAGLPTGSNITLSTGDTSLVYRVYTIQSSTVEIGRITISGFGGAKPTLLVGTGLDSASPTAPLTPGGLNLQSVEVSGNVDPILQIAVTREVGVVPGTNGTVFTTNGVRAWRIVRIDARDIRTDVTHNGGADPAYPVLNAINFRTSG